MERNYTKIYFLGIGGIGMSALARYYMHDGYRVAGYDRTATPLTRALEAEGAEVHYEDDINLIPEDMRSAEDTLVILTPAIPADHMEWAWLREKGFHIEKRSQILGHISEGKLCMAVAKCKKFLHSTIVLIFVFVLTYKYRINFVYL